MNDGTSVDDDGAFGRGVKELEGGVLLHADAHGSDRARDLIDLQLLTRTEVDYERTREIGEKLFRYRNCQPWPPIITKGVLWDSLYDAQKGSLPVLSTVDEAIAWANDLIAKIAAS